MLPGIFKAGTRRRITVVFRYDDFNEESSIDLERSILELFHDHGIPLTVGVTPFITAGDVEDPTPGATLTLSDPKVALLRFAVSSLGAEVALHGYSHQTIAIPGSQSFTEFAGISLDEQRRKIKAGRAHLQTVTGASVNTFIPPWNSYDTNTLCAMLETGMNAISADAEGPAPLDSPIHFAPATCTLARLRRSVFWARMTHDPAPVIIVLFHPFDISKTVEPLAKSLGRLARLLKWLAGQPDLTFVTIAQLCKAGHDMGWRRLHAYQSISGHPLKQIAILRGVCPQIYHSILRS